MWLEGFGVDPETRAVVRKLAAAIDRVTGMAVGLAAYTATLDGAAFVDRRKVFGLARKLTPESLSGEDSALPGRVATAMIEQIGAMARELEGLRTRTERPVSIEIETATRESNPRGGSRLAKAD